MTETSADPLEETRRFVKTYWGDADSTQEVMSDLGYMARVNPRGVRDGVAAIRALLSADYESGTLIQLVAWDGNRALNTGTDAEAADWLRQFADMAEDALRRGK